MDDFKEFQGKSLDEAIRAACSYFDAQREKLEIDIIQDAKNGIFGLVGARKAIVRARRAQVPRVLGPVHADHVVVVRQRARHQAERRKVEDLRGARHRPHLQRLEQAHRDEAPVRAPRQRVHRLVEVQVRQHRAPVHVDQQRAALHVARQHVVPVRRHRRERHVLRVLHRHRVRRMPVCVWECVNKSLRMVLKQVGSREKHILGKVEHRNAVAHRARKRVAVGGEQNVPALVHTATQCRKLSHNHINASEQTKRLLHA